MANDQKPSRLLRWPEVEARVGICKSYMYILRKSGKFPSPVKIIHGGRAVGWLESDVDRFIEGRISNRASVEGGGI